MLKFTLIQSNKTSNCEAHDVQLLHQYICGCDNADVVSGGLRQSDNAHRLLICNFCLNVSYVFVVRVRSAAVYVLLLLI